MLVLNIFGSEVKWVCGTSWLKTIKEVRGCYLNTIKHIWI
jgi:hypothetical protein